MLNGAPNPGSDEAVKIGCTCARMDNAYGRGFYGREGVFVITETCPVHTRASSVPSNVRGGE